MSIESINKRLIGLIVLLLIGPSMPLDASDSGPYYVPSGQSSYGLEHRLVWNHGGPIRNARLAWSLSPNNGTATLSYSSTTDNDGRIWFQLTFGKNACGTYTVRLRLSGDPRPSSFVGYKIVYAPCPTVPSSGTTSLSAPKLEKISDDNQVTAPGDSVSFTVELQDSDGSPMSDVDMNFSILSGDESRASLSPVKATTDANGRAQTTLLLGTGASGEYIVKAYSSDNSDIYTEFNVTVDPSLPKATRLEQISGNKQTGLTGGALENPFVVKVLDQYEAALAGTEVTFTVLTGGGTLSTGTTTTGANGQATSTLSLGAAPGTNTVKVSAAGVSETVTFTAEGIPPTLTSVSGNNQMATTGTTVANPFVVEVRDGNDNPLAGVAVTFAVLTGGGTLSDTTSTTDANGQATSTLILGTAPGTNTVKVSAAGVSETVTFTAEGILPTLTSVSGNNQLAATGTALANPFVVKVLDGNGNPLAGVAVTFAVVAGGGTLSDTTSTTDANGQATSTLILGADSGTNTVKVSAAGISETVTFTAEGLPPTLTSVSGNNQMSATGTALANPFVVKVRDGNGNPLAGVVVTFAVLTGGGTLSDTTSTTDANGQAASTLSLGTAPGTNSVEVSAEGVSETVTFTAEGIPPTLTSVSGNNQMATTGTTLSNPFVVEVRDGDGNPLAAAVVTFAVLAGGGTLSNTTSTTDANGQAASTLSLGEVPGTNSVEVSAEGVSETVTFTAEGIPPTLTSVSGNNQMSATGTALANPFVVEVRDQYDAPMEGITVKFTVLAGSGLLSATTAITDANGRAESTLTLGPNLGPNRVSVSVAGIRKQEVFTAEGIRVAKTLNVISGNNLQGQPGMALENPFVVEVRDQSDKPLSDVEVAFTVTSGGGTISAARVTTDSNGRAESTLKLGPNLGANTVTVSVQGIQEMPTFRAEGVQVPKTLEIVSGDGQAGWPGFWLAEPFVVEVRDVADRPVSAIEVRFTVSSGGGTLSSTSVTTDSDGRAQSYFLLGQNAGANTVTVSVVGVQEELKLTAVGRRIPKSFSIITGNEQRGLLGEVLPNPIVVQVRDRSGEALPGVQVTFTVTGGGGTLSETSATTDSDGRAESTLTLGPNPGTNTVEVAVTGIPQPQTVTATAEFPPTLEDVNRDNVVNILDLVRVASDLGTEGADLPADVNGDGIVNILDLVLVARALGNATAAPSAWNRNLEIAPTRADVGEWLAQARELDLKDATSQLGVLFLEHLLATLSPEETVLLPNFPNPFNPETWIPYQLSEDSPVSLSIYDTAGALVRTLSLGVQPAGFYNSRDRAAYWDGRNDAGERVASGLYFYQLRTPSFHQTRRLVIVK